jgi:hypothetical protein
LKEAEDSSLSYGSCNQYISAAIRQHHLHESIFHLFIYNLEGLDSFSGVAFFLPPREVFLSFEEASPFPRMGAIGK